MNPRSGSCSALPYHLATGPYSVIDYNKLLVFCQLILLIFLYFCKYIIKAWWSPLEFLVVELQSLEYFWDIFWDTKIKKGATDICNAFFCGERGIRTPGPVKINGFQDRRIRPLCHLSSKSRAGFTPVGRSSLSKGIAKVRIKSKLANYF